MISKELFAAVMASELPQGLCELNDLTFDSDNDVGYYHAQYQQYVNYGIQYINIHELAYKCKEWASKQDIYIWSSYNFALSTGRAIFDLRLKRRYGDVLPKFAEHEFETDTEPEAIFKACQWILENKG